MFRKLYNLVRERVANWRNARRASRPGYVPTERQLGLRKPGRRRAAPLHARVIAAVVPAGVRSRSRSGVIARSRRATATRRPASRGGKVGRHSAGRPGTTRKPAEAALKRKQANDRKFSERATGEMSFGDTLRLARNEN